MDELRILAEDSRVLVNAVLRMKAEDTQLMTDTGDTESPVLSLRLAHLGLENSAIVEILSLAKVMNEDTRMSFIHGIQIFSRFHREREGPRVISSCVSGSALTAWAQARSVSGQRCSKTSTRPSSSTSPGMTTVATPRCLNSISATCPQPSRNGRMASSSSISSLCPRSLLASVWEKLSFR